MKAGLIMMALALVLLIAAVVVSVALRSDPERVVAEVATKFLSEAPRYSSGEEGSATKKSSSAKKSLRYPTGEEESKRYGSSSSSGGPVGQREEDAEEPQAVRQQEAEPPNSQSARLQLADGQTSSEAPSGPQPQPQQHQSQPQEQPLPGAEPPDEPTYCEFKEMLSCATKKDKGERVKDISSFSNADLEALGGYGYMIFGVSNDGRVVSIGNTSGDPPSAVRQIVNGHLGRSSSRTSHARWTTKPMAGSGSPP